MVYKMNFLKYFYLITLIGLLIVLGVLKFNEPSKPTFVMTKAEAHGLLFGYSGLASQAVTPVNMETPEIWGLDYPNNGTDTSLTGVSTTLTAQPGTYSGSVITRSYNWHTVNAPSTSLGTGATLTIN